MERWLYMAFSCFFRRASQLGDEPSILMEEVSNCGCGVCLLLRRASQLGECLSSWREGFPTADFMRRYLGFFAGRRSSGRAILGGVTVAMAFSCYLFREFFSWSAMTILPLWNCTDVFGEDLLGIGVRQALQGREGVITLLLVQNCCCSIFKSCVPQTGVQSVLKGLK